MDLAVVFAVFGAASGVAALAFSWADKAAPKDAPGPAAAPAVSAAPLGVSLDGLVQHYLVTGVAAPRTDDALPFDQPLAPEAPRPSPGSLSDLVARLPVIPRAEGSVGG